MPADKQGIGCEAWGGNGNVSLAIWTFVKTTEFSEVERTKDRTNIKGRSSKWALWSENFLQRQGSSRPCGRKALDRREASRPQKGMFSATSEAAWPCQLCTCG